MNLCKSVWIQRRHGRFFKILPVVMVALTLPTRSPGAGPDSSGTIQALQAWLAQPRADRTTLSGKSFAATPISAAGAAAALDALWLDRLEFLRSDRSSEMEAKVIELDGLKMKFECLSFGATNAIPSGGRSLFISLHGGGGAPKQLNDAQWNNQVKLGRNYRPEEGLYVAPRAPTDAWDLWHQAHIDDFFARLVEDFVALQGVDPNRVYVMGYSAGGDGVYQITPRTADRWAAAAMMAGHPNEASPLGLRNVPFAIQVGANDTAYKRNAVAAEWGHRLDALHHADPEGYIHFTELHAGKGHWMDLEDRKAIPWMAQFTRNPLPPKVVWLQDDVTHTNFYWLARPMAEVKAGQLLMAERAGQVITLTSTQVETVTVLLNDELLDLDQPVVVVANGEMLFSNRVHRTIADLARTLAGRGDRDLAFSAHVAVKLPQRPAAPADDDAGH